jgi:glycosyltransferase involved in cell wall biosynthesis
MRILLLQEADWLKRGPHQQHHLIDRMALRGHKIHVIDHQFQWREDPKGEVLPGRVIIPRAYKIFPEAGAHITLVRPRAIKLPGVNTASIVPFHLMEILRQVKEFKPDVILSFGILNAYLGLRVAKQNQIPFVYYLIDQLHTLLYHPFKQVVAKRVERWNLQLADEVLVINKALKEYAKSMGASESKISVITAGVDSAMFNSEVDGHAIRERYGVSPDETLLLFTGFLYQFSGIKEVARSILEAPDARMKLMMVGNGDLYNPLIQMVAQQNASDRIILPGKVPFEEMPEYVAAADICLLPAYKNKVMMNIVPIKMYEYMAMGKPVITTKLSGIVQEFGFDNGIAYVHSAEDVVKKALELRELGVREQGEKAKALVSASSWDVITDAFEAKLEAMLLRQAPRRSARSERELCTSELCRRTHISSINSQSNE